MVVCPLSYRGKFLWAVTVGHHSTGPPAFVSVHRPSSKSGAGILGAGERVLGAGEDALGRVAGVLRAGGKMSVLLRTFPLLETGLAAPLNILVPPPPGEEAGALA